MNNCDQPHIPERLHTKERPALEDFFIEEELYWRCKPEIDLPYQEISLTEISHNRQGKLDNLFSIATDVLWNTDKNKDFEKYEYDIIVLKIKELCFDSKYVKEFKETINKEEILIIIELLHDPIACNYAHSIFRYTYKGIIVTFENYKQTLGHKRAKRLRTHCKLELQAMILRRELRLNY
ncbi:MAG: hypothetical protein RLZZ306_2061 [Bacteroidota bacterium]